MKKYILQIVLVLFFVSIGYARWGQCKDCIGQYGSSWYDGISFNGGYNNLQKEINEAFGGMDSLKRQIKKNKNSNLACCREATFVYESKREELIELLRHSYNKSTRLPLLEDVLKDNKETTDE